MAKKKRPKQNTGELWDQMAGETARNYELFCAYRDMRYDIGTKEKPRNLPKIDLSRERSIRRLGEQLGISHKPLETLSATFKWVERCEAYDKHMMNRAREKNEAELLKMYETHAALGRQLMKKALARLLTIPEGDISAADLVRMADVGVKIERLSRGESTENQKVTGEVAHSGSVNVQAPGAFDLSSLTDEELSELEKLLGKVQ